MQPTRTAGCTRNYSGCVGTHALVTGRRVQRWMRCHGRRRTVQRVVRGLQRRAHHGGADRTGGSPAVSLGHLPSTSAALLLSQVMLILLVNKLPGHYSVGTQLERAPTSCSWLAPVAGSPRRLCSKGRQDGAPSAAHIYLADVEDARTSSANTTAGKLKSHSGFLGRGPLSCLNLRGEFGKVQRPETTLLPRLRRRRR